MLDKNESLQLIKTNNLNNYKKKLLKKPLYNINLNITDPIFYILFKICNFNPTIFNSITNIHNFLQRNTFYILLNLLFYYLNKLGIYTYRKTLQGCKGTQEECLKINIINFFKNMAIYMVYSIIIVGTTISLSIWKYISRLFIIYLFYKYYLLYQEDHYSDLARHGQYNMIILVIGVFVVIIFLNFFIILRRLNLKGLNLTIYLLLCIIILLSLKIIKIIKRKSDCHEWEWGLNNTNINKYNYTSECSIDIPKLCRMYAYKGIFDFSSLVHVNCSNINYKSSRNLLLNHLKRYSNYNFMKTTKFGYPNTNLISFYNISNVRQFNKKVISKIIDYNNSILNNLTESEKPEIVLEFNNDYSEGKININVTYKENLVKEIKLKENNNSIYDNILFIFFDSLSRAHFQRSMKKTCKLIEKFMKKNNYLYTAYQFNKYHSLGINTHPNVFPMFYGKSYYGGNGQNILKSFKENGYITAQISNLCSKDLYEIDGVKYKYVHYENFDHENVGMWCDPNYYNSDNPYPLNRGEFSVIRRCLYGKEAYEYNLEYAKQFWNKYKNSKKYIRLSFIEGHEITAEVIKYLDEPIYQFLEDFIINDSLNNTAIIITSDHGLHYGIYFNIISRLNFPLI